MRRPIVLVVVLAATLAGCGKDDPAPTPPPAGLAVQRAGVSATPSGLSVGAVLRNPRPDDALEVEIEVEFLHVSGRVLGRAVERLPYCPASGECLWGAAFTADVVSDQAVAGVRAVARVAGWARATRSAPFVVVGRRGDGSVSGRAPPDGAVVVVSFAGGAPRAGVMRRTTEPAFVVPPDLLPPAPGEALRAVFYAEAFPPGD